MSAAISLIGVSRHFQRGSERVHAVREVDLYAPSGSFGVLMGPSGSGKSTLLNLIAGFDRPDEGEVRIGDIADDASPRPGKVAFIFQNFRLSPILSALENVELALLPLDRSSKSRRQRALAALTAVGLAERAEHRPHQLSGGQQQRVGIARALAVNPEVVLADEPTATLDSQNGAQIMALLRELSRASKTTVLVATHDTRWLEGADYCLNMCDGELKA